MSQMAAAQARMPVQSPPAQVSGVLQRKCDKCQKKKPFLQRSSIGPALDTVPPIVHEVLHSPGQPLDRETREFMEPRFGHDFSKVRVHTDAKAAESARAVNARAYTVGRHVAFDTGHYTPSTPIGRQLLAHELVHVVQQDQAQSFGPLSPAGDTLENFAENAAGRIMNGEPVDVRGGSPASLSCITQPSPPPCHERNPTFIDCAYGTRVDSNTPHARIAAMRFVSLMDQDPSIPRPRPNITLADLDLGHCTLRSRFHSGSEPLCGSAPGEVWQCPVRNTRPLIITGCACCDGPWRSGIAFNPANVRWG
jgi:hypothetical protein